MREVNVPPAGEAERAVLGAMLQDNRVIDDVALILRERDFRSFCNRVLFTEILNLHNRGEPADKVTMAGVMERIITRNQQADVPATYIAELWDAAPSPANAAYYARLVRDASVRQQLVQVATDIHRAAVNPTGPPEDILAAAERGIFGIAEENQQGNTMHIRQAFAEEFDRLDAMKAGTGGVGIQTGLIDLDVLTGGFRDSELVILAARPSIGKTSLALTLAIHASLKANVGVFFASLEQSRVELAGRIGCAEAPVSSSVYRQGFLSTEEIAKLHSVRDKFSKTEFHVADYPVQTVTQIAANARRLKRQHGIKLIIIDYLQLVEPDNRRESRQEQVAGVSRRLKQLARELTVPVVALAQLNRGAETQDKPRLCDLRESGGIEADADVVVLLHVPDDAKKSEIGAIVAKQRNGPTGELTLWLDREHMKFQNFEHGREL